ncbi:MAG: DUF1326 domain-containing protein [Dehalococcoidia bacterium]|jgi:hypothetical protein
MTAQKGWRLKGTFYECCRVEDGHCGLWFGRDLPRPCANLATYQIKEGEIQGVDMSGITIILHKDGIGPRFSDLAKGVKEGAAYISDHATDEQRKILAPFVAEDLSTEKWRQNLGVKFVKIDISQKDGVYHITMPFGEQKMALTVGGDGKNPMRIENFAMPSLSNIRFCNTQFWKYHDYGKNLEFHNTSGAVADFDLSGD